MRSPTRVPPGSRVSTRAEALGEQAGLGRLAAPLAALEGDEPAAASAAVDAVGASARRRLGAARAASTSPLTGAERRRGAEHRAQRPDGERGQRRG